MKLSERKKDILWYASNGKTNKYIANELSISTHTVNMHLKDIREFLCAENTTEAVAIAIREGIID